MSIRVSSSAMFDRGPRQIGTQQAGIVKIQDQISSGKRITKPSDDPSGAARILDLKYSNQAVDQILRNQQTAQTRLDQTESVIASATNILQNISENTVRIQNGTYSQLDMKSFATDIRGSVQELLGLANSRDAEGNFIFAGFAAKTQPFTQAGSEIVYNGDSGEVMAQIGLQRKMRVSDSGQDMFMAIKDGNGTFSVNAQDSNLGSAKIQNSSVQDKASLQKGNYDIDFALDALGNATYTVTNTDNNSVVTTGTYKSGESIAFDGMQITLSGAPADGDKFSIEPAKDSSIFDMLLKFADTLENAANNESELAVKQTQVFAHAQNVERALDHMINTRVDVGSRLSEIDTFQGIMATSSELVLTEISSYEDLDYAKAISELTKKQTIFQAAQMSYMKIISSSMFDYMK